MITKLINLFSTKPLSAEEALKQSKANNKKLQEEEFEIILAHIKKMVKKGSTYSEVSNGIHPNNLKRLKELGYTVGEPKDNVEKITWK